MATASSDRRRGLTGDKGIKAPVKLATTANITLSGEQSIDGVTTSSNRVLVKDQTDTSANGIYDTGTGAWTRALDFNGNSDIARGTMVRVTHGTVNAGTMYSVSSDAPTSIGSSAITFETAVAVADIATQLANTSSTSYGDALVGVKRTATGAAATTLHAIIEKRDFYAQEDFGATADGTTDDTSAITACFNAAYVAGGTVHLPVGTCRVTTLPFNWDASKSVRIVGRGTRASALQKLGATTAPVLDLSADVGILDCYSELADFSVIGLAKAGHGIRLTRNARSVLRNLYVTTCDVGLENVGGLIFQAYDCNFNSNNIGIRSRKSGSIYGNQIKIRGGAVRDNSSFGFDIGESNGFHLDGVDVEVNGTTANTATGAVKIRATVDDEFGYAIVTVKDSWFEGNYGDNFVVDAAGGLALSIRDTIILNSEGGNAINVGAVQSVTIDGIVAGSVGDEVILAATASCVSNSVINTLTDTSTVYEHKNVATGSGTIQFKSGGSSGRVQATGGSWNSGSGTVATTSAVAATMFAAPDTPGLYLVYAYVADAGTNYMSFAEITYDGTTLVRKDGTNGANLTITVSGTDVQATQSSGAAQTVAYAYVRIG